MKKISVRLNTYDLLCLCSIILLGIWQVLRCPDLPGLYLDAVNPDYLAVQMLFPQINNPDWGPSHTGLPLLGNLYHGTITIWLQILMVGLFGKASILTVRLSNIIYVIGICWIMYLILKSLKVSKIISFLALSSIMLSPNVFSFIRTQYYIKLPGTLLLMLSIYLAMLSIEQNRHAAYLILSGVALGVAFYSYFIFLFFAPAILVFCLSKTKKLELNYFRDAVIWCVGFGCGSLPYVIGYSDLIVTSMDLNLSVKRTIVVAESILLITVAISLSCILVKRYQCNRGFYGCFTVVLGVLIFFVSMCIINLDYIMKKAIPKLDALEIAGTSMNFGERIIQIAHLWLGVMSNRFQEGLMLADTSSRLSFMVVILLAIAFGVAFFLTITRRMRKSDWFEIFIWGGILLCYGVFSIPFASRMGGQHFTPTFFVTCMILTLLSDSIWNLSKNEHIKKVSLVLLGIFFFWSVINSNLLQKNLEFTGGRHMYSDTVNTLAEDALREKRKGMNSVYVFPEWGFWCEFDYLTMNQIPYMFSVDTDMLDKYLDKGYGFNICTWENKNVKQYMELLNEADINDVSLKIVRSREGEAVFYIIKREPCISISTE